MLLTRSACVGYYHHLSDAAAINASLYAALKPGGHVAIIEMEPTGLFSPFRVWPHWTDDAQVVADLSAARFTHLRTDRWLSFSHYVAGFAKE